MTVTKAFHAADIVRQRDTSGSIQPHKVSIQTPAVSAMVRPTIVPAAGLQYQLRVSQITVVPIVPRVPRAVQPAAAQI